MKVQVAVSKSHHLAFNGLMAEGLRRHGHDVTIVNLTADLTAEADMLVVWGWRNGQVARRLGRAVLVLERGYVGDRQQWTSVGFDGLNGRARFPLIVDGGDRWSRHFPEALQPAREGFEGEFALVLGQVPGDMSLAKFPGVGWYRQAADALTLATGLPARIRPHPLDRSVNRRGGKVHGLTPLPDSWPLDVCLAKAGAVAAFNSNSLTDAALAGIPITAGDPGAMTWPIAGHRLREPPRLGSRARWAARLAWTQWLPGELESGTAWEAVRLAMEPNEGFRFGEWHDPSDSGHARAT